LAMLRISHINSIDQFYICMYLSHIFFHIKLQKA
jgi:hypothetical protein